MAFPDSLVQQAYSAAGNCCQCNRKTCGHGGQCNKPLKFELRGFDGIGGWEAHHRHSLIHGGGDNLGNCEILCQECHKNTGSNGG